MIMISCNTTTTTEENTERKAAEIYKKICINYILYQINQALSVLKNKNHFYLHMLYIYIYIIVDLH